jgi:hypothetical protein
MAKKPKQIAEVDMDDAEYLGTGGDGMYFTAAEGKDGWYLSMLVDSDTGHFCEPYTTDDGPYESEGAALMAGLCGASDWLVENQILRGWRTDFNRLYRRYKRQAAGKLGKGASK